MFCEILKKRNRTNHKWKKINSTIGWINIYRYFKEYKDYTAVLVKCKINIKITLPP